MKFSSIEHKLLLVFAAFLLIVTALNAGLASYLINRQSETEAFARLSRQLLLFRNDLHVTREAQLAVATDAARDGKNLSDLAILYGQAIKQIKEPGAALDSTLDIGKVASLNRLQLILLSARLSSAAVYLQGELSHYVTRDAAGMAVRRDGQPALIGTGQRDDGKIALGEWWNWQPTPLPMLVDRRLPSVNRMTVIFDFPGPQTMVMRVIAPIQGVPRASFNETIVEDVGIATAETPLRRNGEHSNNGDSGPVVIGMFVFSKVFDLAYLEEMAAKTGMFPAIVSPDGQRHVQLVKAAVPAVPALLAPGDTNDASIRLQTVNIGADSYYQAVMPWQADAGGPVITLSLELTRENTLNTIRQTVAGIIAVAVLILIAGGAIGYVLVARLVAPIKALAASVSRTVAGTRGETPGQALTPDLSAEINLGAGDEVMHLTAAFDVMTERVRQAFETLEQRVDERTVQLAAANKELEAFAYSVSHDLRAPLRHIDGFLSLLKENLVASLDEQNRHYMDTISRAARRMGILIDDLLSFSRMGRQEINRRPVDLGAVVQDVIHEFEPEIGSRAVAWHIDELPVVDGDRAMLRVVLVNLLSNALKFTQPRAQAEIDIGCLRENDDRKNENETVVFVRDNGVGFDMRYADKLFGVFERLHGVEEFEGTGIGLANVHRVISRHGGRTWAEGKVDGGATFYFSLPQISPV